SVTDPTPGSLAARSFTIVLTSLPSMYDDAGVSRKPQVGDRLSPFTDRANIIAKSVEAYFDSLGPGELVASDSVRYARAARQPKPAVQYPTRAGQGMMRYILSGLGGTAADAELTSISRNDPDLPTNMIDDPNMVTFGPTNVYPL